MKNKFSIAILLGVLYSSGLMAQEMSIGAPIGAAAAVNADLGKKETPIKQTPPVTVTPATQPSAAAATNTAPIAKPATPIGIGAPVMPTTPDKGSLVVNGPPKKEGEEVSLKYFDPSKKLTIAEMSEIERQKLTNSFLAKYGYTTTEPPKPIKTEKPKPPPPAPDVIIVKAIYGNSSRPQIDLSINGRVMKMKVGANIVLNNKKRINLVDINSKTGVSMSIEEAKTCSKNNKCKEGKKKIINAMVGETIEFQK